MTGLKHLTAAATCALLTACAAGPDYRTPTADAAMTGGFVKADPALVSSAELPAGWWRLFEDPTLDALVTEALAANKDIAAASANLAQVRASLSETRSLQLPATLVTGSAARIRAPNPLTGEMVEADSFNAGIDVAYEVDLFGRVRRAVEASRADTDAAQAALDAVRISVAAETARAYADACSANTQLAVANRTLDLLDETSSLTSRQLRLGRGTGADVAAASAQTETARASLSPLEAQRDSALFRLAVLTGKPPSQAPAVALSCTSIPRVARAIPVGDGAALLRRRPDVRQAERRLAAATARIGVATAALYPSVTLGGAISTSAADAGDLGDDYQFNVGPLINWSFPNVAASRARIRQASAAADAALARFDQTNLIALQEVETALSAYARELDRRAALQRARDQSAEAVRLTRLRRDAGVDSFLAVLIAERTLAALEAQLAASEAQVTTNQIALFKALGGGWESAA